MRQLTPSIPARLRSWSVRWPEYAPVDITPPELRPAELARHVPDWAEAAPTPAGVRDWAQRQTAALVAYELDEQGWPLHPSAVPAALAATSAGGARTRPPTRSWSQATATSGGSC